VAFDPYFTIKNPLVLKIFAKLSLKERKKHNIKRKKTASGHLG
jgi:hypothetical protein